MENKDDLIPSVNSSTSPRSKISYLLPSDILEEIGVTKVHKNPKVSVSSNNLKYDSLNDDDIKEIGSVNNNYGSSKYIYRSNMNAMEIMNNFKANNYVEYFGKINNYPKFKNNFPSSPNPVIMRNTLQNNNINIPNINPTNNSIYFNNNLIEGGIRRVNSNKPFIPPRMDFLDNFPQNVNSNNINNYNCHFIGHKI